MCKSRERGTTWEGKRRTWESYLYGGEKDEGKEEISKRLELKGEVNFKRTYQSQGLQKKGIL